MVRRVFDVEALLDSIEVFRAGGQKPADVFVAAGVNQTTDEAIVESVRSALERRPDLIGIWQDWSYDKRWSPSPYLDDLEVGHYDAGTHHARRHANPVDACADFVLGEVRWVVDRRVVERS